jgi:hypothetical protein
MILWPQYLVGPQHIEGYFEENRLHSERDFFEHRKRNPAAGFFRSEGTVVVKADTDGDGNSFRAVSGAHKERIPEVIGRSCLSHNGDRKAAGVKCMSRAGRNAHKTAQAFLNEGKRVVVDRDRRLAAFVIGSMSGRLVRSKQT